MFGSQLLIPLTAVYLTGTMAQLAAQTCQGVAGSWVDNYNYTWNLRQSGYSISGSVTLTPDPPPCGPGPWTVNGSINTLGTFTITASGGGCAPVTSFTYTGTITSTGCNVGSGTWTNNIDSNPGNWNWSKSCDKPDYELTSSFSYWDDTLGGDPTVGDWRAKLGSNSGLVFGSRTVTEQDGGGGVDGCYFTGSIYGPSTVVPNTSTEVNWDQTYGDGVGASSTLTNYYRAQRPAQGLSMPCGWTFNQNVVMMCTASTFLQFTSNNQLKPGIGTTTVTSCRQTPSTQNCVSRTWP